jgi:hypothetical protein
MLLRIQKSESRYPKIRNYMGNRKLDTDRKLPGNRKSHRFPEITWMPRRPVFCLIRGEPRFTY